MLGLDYEKKPDTALLRKYKRLLFSGLQLLREVFALFARDTGAIPV